MNNKTIGYYYYLHLFGIKNLMYIYAEAEPHTKVERNEQQQKIFPYVDVTLEKCVESDHRIVYTCMHKKWEKRNIGTVSICMQTHILAINPYAMFGSDMLNTVWGWFYNSVCVLLYPGLSLHWFQYLVSFKPTMDFNHFSRFQRGFLHF